MATVSTQADFEEITDRGMNALCRLENVDVTSYHLLGGAFLDRYLAITIPCSPDLLDSLETTVDVMEDQLYRISRRPCD